MGRAPTKCHDPRSGVANNLPSILQNADDCLRDLVNKGGITRELEKYWQRTRSADGFDPVPAALPDAHIDESKAITVDPRFPLRSSVDTNGKLRIAVNGLVQVVPYSDSIVNILQRLNTGEPIRIDDLEEYVGVDTGKTSELHGLLKFLSAARAFQANRDS